jgi:Fe-S cluster assembly protein SufD
MSLSIPVRLGPAEQTLIEQLNAAGATAEAERLAGSGLPTRKVETYHYTDLKMLLRQVPALSAAANAPAESLLPVDGALRLSIVNGVPQPASVAAPGVTVGTAEGGILSQRDDVIVRLNSALVKEALTIDIAADADALVVIDRQTVGAAAHAPTAAKVFVAGGAKATIVDVCAGSDAAHVTNHASYFALGKGAEVLHVLLDLSSRKSTHFATAEYHIGEEARLRTLVIHAGAGLARTQLFPRYGGAGAHADVTGLNLVDDTQHQDITMDANHAVPHTSSKPLFKSIARGRSRAVVQGRLVVARDAQKTDAKLMAQGLMLSDDAEIVTKPELEIYADDVVCGHGSTCGRLDDEAMFYLMSRGVPRDEAETMLVRAFLEELLDPIENEQLREGLSAITERWLRGA